MVQKTDKPNENTYHAEWEDLLDALVLALDELLLRGRLALEGQRHRRFQCATHLLLLVSVHALLFEHGSLTIFVVWGAREILLVGSHGINLTVARSERLVRALVRLGQLAVDRVSQLVA